MVEMWPIPVLTLISVSVPPVSYLNSTKKSLVILPKVQVAGHSKTYMHPTYVAWNEVKMLVHSCIVYTERAPRRQQFHMAPAM